MRRSKPTKAQKDAAQERRKAFGRLVTKISKMPQQEREAMVLRFGGIVSAEGKPLSLFNTCLLLTQDEQATMVGGFRQWQAVGRQVRKGEHGLAMWFPLTKKAEGTEWASLERTRSPK